MTEATRMTKNRMLALAVAITLALSAACSTQPPPAPSSAPAPAASAAPTATAEPSSPTSAAAEPERELDIVTLLPFDAIPAVLDPKFISAKDADAKLAELLENRARKDADEALLKGGSDPDDALVLGLSINGDSRAYYIPSLSSIEIVNDTVGGQPLAVTW